MALTFPNNPTTGQNYTAENGLKYQYDGEKWTTLGSSLSTGDAIPPDGSVTPAKLSSGGPSWDTSGKLTTPSVSLDPGTTGSPFVRDSSGRIGVGTATLGSSGNASITIAGANNSGIQLSRNNAAEGGALITSNSGPGCQFFSYTGAVGSEVYSERMRLSGAGVFTLGDGATNAVSLDPGSTGSPLVRDSSGRLLVGTATARTNFYGATYSPQLQINGTTDRTSSLSLVCTDPSNNQAGALLLGASKGAGGVSDGLTGATQGLGLITFQGNNGTGMTEAARINGVADGAPSATSMPGRLSFSTTPSGSTAAVERMRIGADGLSRFFGANHAGFFATAQASSGSFGVIVVRHSATSATTGTDSFIVLPNGNVQNTNNSYGAISDIKLKENIVDAKSQWDDIKGLRLVNYNFKAETGAETNKQLGLIAQEVEAVCPGLVGETPDVDENGDPTGEVTKNVAYSVLYMKAVGALQEAMAKIEDLQARVDALENPTV